MMNQTLEPETTSVNNDESGSQDKQSMPIIFEAVEPLGEIEQVEVKSPSRMNSGTSSVFQ